MLNNDNRLIPRIIELHQQNNITASYMDKSDNVHINAISFNMLTIFKTQANTLNFTAEALIDFNNDLIFNEASNNILSRRLTYNSDVLQYDSTAKGVIIKCNNDDLNMFKLEFSGFIALTPDPTNIVEKFDIDLKEKNNTVR